LFLVITSKLIIMENNFSLAILTSITFLAIACNSNKSSQKDTDSVPGFATTITTDSLAKVSESNMKFSNIIGWADKEAPTAPAGFTVTRFAEGIKSPRHTYIAPNGDVLIVLSNSERTVTQKIMGKVVGQSGSEVGGKSANTIMLYRDANADGVAETISVFLSGLNQPFGMLIIGNKFYVANTDGVVVYPYQLGSLKITNPGEKIVDLPAGGYNNHWTRNLIANADDSKIYISVGSGSNVGENGMENEVRRANILEVNIDGSGEKIYAAGL
jgi:glucose/arabinose dehydrogenase